MMTELKKKLNSLDPALFTEEVQNQLVSIVESKIEEAKTAAFTEGFERATTTLDEDHADKLTAILEKIDTDHAEKLQKLVEQIDEDHTAKLQKLVESIDEDHTAKLQLTLEALDTDHTAKLEKVKAFYESKYETMMVEKISEYLDTYLEECAPAEAVVNTIKLNRLEEAVTAIKKVLVLSDDFVNSEISEAILEAKAEIDSRDKKINALMVEKIELTKKLKKDEAIKLLESKTSGMAPAKAAYVNKYFEGSTIDEISAKLDEAVTAFEVDQRAKRSELMTEKHQTVSDGIKIPKPADESQLISEQTETSGEMDVYVTRINKSFQARK